jgi:hypothetical protein
MPIHIDEVQSDVQVQSPSRGGTPARGSVPGQPLADWQRLQRQASTDRARTCAWGNDTGDSPDLDGD